MGNEAKLMISIGTGLFAGWLAKELSKNYGAKKSKKIGTIVGCLATAAMLKQSFSRQEERTVGGNDLWFQIGKNMGEEKSSGRKVIIGISTSDSVWGKTFGEHAFIMCINEIDPQKSIMLDASGHYGMGRSADVLDGLQMPITIDNYLKYWNTDEKLTTFELKLSALEESKIRNAILNIEGRSWLSCASKASEVLNAHYSSKIEKCATPLGLLDTLNKFSKANPSKVVVKHFDFSTNKEILKNGKD